MTTTKFKPKPHDCQNLFSRFFNDLSEQDWKDNLKLCFHLQEAWWFFLDYMAPSDQDENGKPYLTLFEFGAAMAPYLRWKPSSVKPRIIRFYQYRERIPRCGGILLNQNQDKVLLVRGYYSGKWMFPSGKVVGQESFQDAAQREVFEETGYWGLVSPNFVKYKQRKSWRREFVFYNVPEDFDFKPQSRKEVSEIKWFTSKELARVMDTRSFWPQLSRYLKVRKPEPIFKWVERDKSPPSPTLKPI